MRFNAKIWINDDPDMKYVTFSDTSSDFELSLTRFANEDEVEILMCHQSWYRPKEFHFSISSSIAELKLPKGTVDPIDGDDYFEITYEREDIAFNDIISVLQQVFQNLDEKILKIT